MLSVSGFQEFCPWACMGKWAYMAKKGICGERRGGHGKAGHVCGEGDMHGKGRGMHGKEGESCMAKVVVVSGRERACVAGQTATAEDCTHPTGKHSCRV